MRQRLSIHAAVLLAVLVACIDLPEPVVHASTGGYVEPLILEWTEPENLPRSSQTTRTPEPLPTPIPIDPDATPIPGPIGHIPTPTPVSVQSPSLKWPVSGTITTYYSSAHPAVDIAAPCGTPVIAPASGTIVYAAWKSNGGGLVVDIDLGWATVSLNHLSSIAVTSGWVSQGTVVAYVGATGNARGCHVHWALWRDGAWRNPLAWL